MQVFSQIVDKQLTVMNESKRGDEISLFCKGRGIFDKISKTLFSIDFAAFPATILIRGCLK